MAKTYNIDTFLGQTVSFDGKQGIVFDCSNDHNILWIETSDSQYYDIHKSEVEILKNTKELILSTLKKKSFNGKLHFTSFEKIVPELDQAMEKCYCNIQDAGMDTDQFSFEVIDNVLKLVMGAYNRTQKLNWDMVKNCKADLRKKEYRIN